MVNRIKAYTEICSPISWLVIVLIGFPIHYLVLSPSPSELGVYIGAYFIFLFPLLLIGEKVYLKFYPNHLLIMPYIRKDDARTYSKEQAVEIIRSLNEIPKARALFTLGGAVFVNTPLVCVATFYFEYTHSLFYQMSLVLLIICSVSIYNYAITYIECHDLSSRLLDQLHSVDSFKEAMHETQLPEKADSIFRKQEFVCMGLIWLTTSALIVLILGGSSTGSQLLMEVLFVQISGLIAISRIWFASTAYFVFGMKSLLQSLKNMDFNLPLQTIPLHSIPTLAIFDRAYNELVHKVKNYELELSSELFVRSEKDRFEALGQLSAMIVHDLAGPMHVVNFCSKQLTQQPDLVKNRRYIEKLQAGTDQCIDLITSLKALLKNPDHLQKKANVKESLLHAMRILHVSFRYDIDENFQFTQSIEEEIHDAAISRSNLVHIILNLLGNALTELKRSVELAVTTKPSLTFRATSNVDFIIIEIIDNGRGLSPKQFEDMTGDSVAGGSPLKKGLGMRLIRKLIEENRGSIEVLSSDSGTHFKILLPRYQEMEEKVVNK